MQPRHLEFVKHLKERRKQETGCKMVVTISYSLNGAEGFKKSFFARDEVDGIKLWCDWATEQEIESNSKMEYGRIVDKYPI